MMSPLTCTRCGRNVPDGEAAIVKRERSGDSVVVSVLCALHTEHTIAGNWHDKERYGE